MYVFFFDLDNTLLKTNSLTFLNYLPAHPDEKKRNTEQIISKKMWNNIITSSYNKHIPVDFYLQNLLRQINYPKYIITNASHLHCTLSLENLGINNLWNGCVSLDDVSYATMKPNPRPYLLATNMSNTTPQKKTFIFFDDMEINLIVPKQLGWVTVLIGKKHNPYEISYIDYSFFNIYEALNFFIKATK
jgi:HAD superfamily hydrolase (TIGR01509 family)